jgi:hypothetical protein
MIHFFPPARTRQADHQRVKKNIPSLLSVPVRKGFHGARVGFFKDTINRTSAKSSPITTSPSIARAAQFLSAEEFTVGFCGDPLHAAWTPC